MNNSRLLFVLLFVSICVQLHSAAAIQAKKRSEVSLDQLDEGLLQEVDQIMSNKACPTGSIYNEKTGLCITIIINPPVQNVFGNGGLGNGDEDGNSNGKKK